MKIPKVTCKIEVYAAVNPSEDPDKVRLAVSKVILETDYQYKEGSIKAISHELESISKIQETIKKHRSNRVYRRQMRYNTKGDTTWFYLNKQAAFVDVIAICEEAEESAMGPIKVILHSKDLDKIMDWLAPDDREITG
ncbi:MAG: RNA-binding domain-containing protein [Nitrosotalea sp.]